jgi:hypothetical protein
MNDDDIEKKYSAVHYLMGITAFHAGYLSCSVDNEIPADKEKIIDATYKFFSRGNLCITKDMIRIYLEKIDSLGMDIWRKTK